MHVSRRRRFNIAKALLVSGLAAAAALGSGCSLKAKNETAGIQLKLRPTEEGSQPFSALDFNPFIAAVTPSAVTGYGCYAVNAKTSATTSTCGIPVGTVAGPFSNIDSDFTFNLAVDGDVTFEAYGLTDTNCGAAFPTGATGLISKIGEAKLSASSTTSSGASIDLPVSLSGATAHACNYFTTFSDAFTGSGSLSGTGNWVSGAGTTFALGAGAATASGSATYANTNSGVIDPSLAYTRLTANISVTGTPTFAIQALQTAASGFACGLDFSSANPLFVQQLSGTTQTSTGFTASAIGTLTCTIQNISTNSVTITATYPDTMNVPQTFTYTFALGTAVSPQSVGIQSVVAGATVDVLDVLVEQKP